MNSGIRDALRCGGGHRDKAEETFFDRELFVFKNNVPDDYTQLVDLKYFISGDKKLEFGIRFIKKRTNYEI